MFGFSFSELLVICVVALVAVGPQKLPGMLKTMGQWARKLRQMTMDVRQQTGIDEMLRAEGIQISELRSLMRGYHPPAPAAAPTPAPVSAPARYDDPYASVEPDPTREYPPEGADSYGALPDDLLEPATSNEVADAPGAPAPKPEPTPDPKPEAAPEPEPVAAAPVVPAAPAAPVVPAALVATAAPVAAAAPAAPAVLAVPATPGKPDSLPEVEPEPEPVAAKPTAPVRSVPPPPPSSRAVAPRPSGTPPPPPRRSLPAPRPEPSSPVSKPETATPAVPPSPGTPHGNG